jgi:glycosyltransferase involved in cell wall biosynthesis
MRVLYDISTLGLGHRFARARGGSYRADERVVESLVASGECELLLCANHSSVAHEGCVAYLRTNPRLAGVPLLAARDRGPTATLRASIAAVHRWTRPLFGSSPLPTLLRNAGTLVDRCVHRPVTAAHAAVDVFHSPATPLPRVRPGDGPPERFLTIYDLRHVRFASMYRGSYAQLAQAAIASVRPRDWIITSSEFSKAELCDCGILPADRIFVVPLAADARFFRPCRSAERREAVRRKYGIPPGDYFLVVTPDDPRKSIGTAVRAFRDFVRQERVRDLSLVLAGHARAAPRRDRDAVVTTGYVDDADLAVLYSGAMAFVYPSVYEGFGLPPLEAMQCGTPVIACDTSSIPEVVGSAGLLVPPADPDAMAAALRGVYRDPALRAALSERSLEQAARFGWDRSAAAMLAAYRTALAARDSS